MKRIERFIAVLGKRQWRGRQPLREWSIRRSRYLAPSVYEHGPEPAELCATEVLDGGYGTTYFLSGEFALPQGWEGEDAGLVYEGGGEGLVRLDGAPYHGLDRNHGFVPLPATAPGQRLRIDIELYDPLPEPKDPLNRQAVIRPSVTGVTLSLVWIDRPVYALLHTVKMIFETARLLPPQDMRHFRLIRALEQAMDDLEQGDEMALADGGLVTVVEKRLTNLAAAEASPGFRDGFIHLVGQSHIDLAWLWPLKETVRKAGRTFSTVLTLIERYPEFRYSQSQPQLYAFIKQHYPELFARIKERVREGRWELVGSMWVEPDLNIPNGESLARQILYGQQFYEREFGKRTAVEWLPDTFGYCASLPQLLKQAGVEYFLTTKLGWNDTNKFPYTLFEWVGIDGTSVIAYQNHGVNESTSPKDIGEHWQAFEEKDRHGELMLLYGHGDGGGGVTHEMLEYAERAKLMAGLPAGRYSTAESFFAKLAERRPELPAWHGDLYLELHRGTYTTQAYNKRCNRKAEALYREAEIWGEFAAWHGAKRETDALREGWELLLLNQFHDIVPGSSIPEVYETSREQYEQVFRLGRQSLDASLQALAEQAQLQEQQALREDAGHVEADSPAEGRPYLVFNCLSWEQGGIVLLEGDRSLLGLRAFDGPEPLESDAWLSDPERGKATLAVRVPAIPAFGCKAIWLREVQGFAAEEVSDPELAGSSVSGDFPELWESAHYLLRFNDQGEIVHWYDKDNGRELLAEGQKGNQLQLFHDRPPLWDAWDLDPRYERQPAGSPLLTRREAVLRGRVLDILRFRWECGRSVIEQEVLLPKRGRRVDFQTKVLWQEDHKLLKVAFPVDVLAGKATYEIPFGALERPTHRNTSWDQAQYEVCGHRFADLSEHGYGVSLLNDCKYGYDIHGNVLRLSLLRAPSWPDRHADRGEHEFTYSLYPHAGDWRAAQVVREAAALNAPLRPVAAPADGGQAAYPQQQSWLDFRSGHVILETVKAAEDGSGSVLRLYESSGGRAEAVIGGLPERARFFAANLLEDECGELHAENGTLRLIFKPFEVKTIKIRLDQVDSGRRDR